MLVEGVYLAAKVVFNQVLITLELGRRIAANALVVVRRDRGIEHVYRQIKDAVLRVFIGLNHLIHRPFRKRLVKVLGGCEVVGVKIALACDKEVDGAQKADYHCRYPLASITCKALRIIRLTLRQIGPQQKPCRCCNQSQRTKGIGPENAYAVFYQRIDQDVLHAGVGSAFEVAEEAGYKPRQQREAAGDAKGPPEGFEEALTVVFFAHYPVQRHEAQYRQRNLQNDQRHGHRAELVVKR